MKKPRKIKENHVKCISCGEPIHIKEFGGVNKKGFFHNNICCLLDVFDKQELII